MWLQGIYLRSKKEAGYFFKDKKISGIPSLVDEKCSVGCREPGGSSVLCALMLSAGLRIKLNN